MLDTRAHCREQSCAEGLAARPSANHPTLQSRPNFQDHLEPRVFEVLRVQQDPQVPRVSLAALAPLGQQVRSSILEWAWGVRSEDLSAQFSCSP